MRITEFAIKHNVAVLVFCAGLVLLGTMSYFAMPRESFPDVKLPFIVVTTVLEGANPTDIEKAVTIPLETELEGTEGLKEMRSISSESLSMISLEFYPDVETETALNRVRDAVDQATGALAALVYIGGRIRQVEPYIGGERLKEQNVVSPATFYRHIMDVAPLNHIYRAASRGFFDIYYLLKKVRFF